MKPMSRNKISIEMIRMRVLHVFAASKSDLNSKTN